MRLFGSFEIIASLSVQVVILISTSAWLATRRRLVGEAHRVWAACHFFVLALVVLAVFVPHLRILPTGPSTFFMEQTKTVCLSLEVEMLLSFIWAIGATVGFLALLLGMIQAVGILRSSRPLHMTNQKKNSTASTAISPSQIQNRKSIQVLSSLKTDKAFCWQFHQPYIVLPDTMHTFPADELHGVIRHEKAHLEAGHPLHLFLQRIVEILFWYHPLVWWASRQATWSREFHCDASAVTTRREAASYLRGLLRITEHRIETGLGLPAGLNFARGKSLVRQRVDQIASRDWNLLPMRPSFAFILTPLLASFALSLGIWLPVNLDTSHRSIWSPWPKISATALHELGITVRDYEIDGHRLRAHDHHQL